MKKKQGISLILLIIVIIVLLILAGVILSSVINNNLIENAKNAVNKYNAASQNEQSMLESLDDLLESAQTNVINVPTINDVPGELETEDNETYYINCIEDLVAFSNSVNDGESYEGKTVVLSKNIDFESTNSYVDSTNTTLFGDYNGDGTTESIIIELSKGTGFLPIGNLATYDDTNNILSGNYFKGMFEGNNKVIQNIYINKSVSASNIANVGLFAICSGTIQNLSVAGDICIASTASSGFACAGSILGIGVTTYITNCNSLASVTITNCSTSVASIGGVCGRMYQTSIIDGSKNYSVVIIGSCNANVNMGGICGGIATGAVIKRSYNEADMENTKTTSGYVSNGGIVGCAYTNTKVYKCCNNGDIIMNGGNSNFVGRIGGIAGTNQGIVQGSYNKGSISSIGITNCWYSIAGGIVASNYGNVSETYSVGAIEVSGASNLFQGGILGEGSGCTNSFYLTGTATGGIKGVNYTGSAEPKMEQELKAENFAQAIGPEFKANSSGDGYPIFEDRYEFACRIVSSGTSISANVDCKSGDLITAIMVTRSTTTIPDGWNRIDTQTILNQDGVNQYLIFAYKYTNKKEESITVTQSSASIMYLNLISISNATNIERVDSLDMVVSGNTVSVPDKPCSELLIWSCHTRYWYAATSSTYNYRWSSSPAIYPIELIPTYEAPRLASFMDFSPIGTSRTFSRVSSLDNSYPSQIVALKVTLSN